MRNTNNNAHAKAAANANANLQGQMLMAGANIPQSNLEEINMILAAQTIQHNQSFNQHADTYPHPGPGHHNGMLPQETNKKSQGQIMLATAQGGGHGGMGQNFNKGRKHSSVRRNQMNKPTQTALAAKQMQAQMAITQNQHQQWMNQTLPVNINKVEGGGSGGSGGSASQEQINDQKHQMQKKPTHQQQRMQQQANQMVNMKNVMLIDQMYQLQQHPQGHQPGKQVRARSNMQQPPGMGGQHMHNQYLAQKTFMANVNSEMQIQTLAAGAKKDGYVSQKRKQVSKDVANFETVQDAALMATNSSKQRIQAQGQANGPINTQNARSSGNNNTAGHSKKGSHGGAGAAHVQAKHNKTNGDRQAVYDKHMDHAIMQQNMALMNQQMANYRNTGAALQTQYNQFGSTQSKGSRQGSKLRKNISNMRGGAQTQLKNAQRVSQQRRFNNTTLDNYQVPLNNNQLSTIQAVAPSFNSNVPSNMQTVQQQISVPGQQFLHNTSSKYEQQMTNTHTASNMLKQGGQGIGGSAARAGPMQSRSVIRQNQQQKQYLNNFLAPNKYNSQHAPGPTQADFGNQMRINNQLIVNKNEPRSKSNLKAPYGQGYGAQANQFLTGQVNDNQNAQFNNYLSQQNYFDHSKMNGQSPLLKKNHPGTHKKSESVADQRPPDQIHGNGQNMKGVHSSSIEPHPSGHKSTYSAMGQLNTGNQKILSNISNPNVNLYQKYNNYKGMTTEGTLAPEATASMHTSIKVKKCDSELSNGTAGHNQLSGDAALGGRASSNDQDANHHHAGGMQQLRRNQPHNFSNISEKSSIMGDYGGTHTTHNSNQAKKSRQGLGGAIPGISGSNQQVQHEHQQFFNNRIGSASHVGASSNNTNGNGNINTNNSVHSTHNTSNQNHQMTDPNNANQRSLLSNQKKAMGKQYGTGGGPSGATPQSLPSGTNLSNADPQEGIHSQKVAQRTGSAGRKGSSQQQRSNGRNGANKFQTQVVNMPGINNSKRIVIGQKQMDAHTMQQMPQQIFVQGGDNQVVGKIPNTNQMTAFQALQNQQQMHQQLQQLQKQQPQLKNVLRSGGPRSTEPQASSQPTAAQSNKKGQRFRKNPNIQQNQPQQATGPAHRLAVKPSPMPATQMGQVQLDNRIQGGTQHTHGFAVDPIALHGAINDTIEQVPNATQFAGGVNRSGARRLSMPTPYQQMHATLQGMGKEQQLNAGLPEKQGMLQTKLDIGQGLRNGGLVKNANPLGFNPDGGNTGALDSGTKNHLYSEDHENYDFDDEDEDAEQANNRNGRGTNGIDEQKAFMNANQAQQQDNQLDQAMIGNTKNMKVPAPSTTNQRDAKKKSGPPQQRIGTQDQIVIKANKVYIRDPTDGAADTGGGDLNTNRMDEGSSLLDANIMIQDGENNEQTKGMQGGKQGPARGKQAKEGEDTKVINYETFESSSEDEYSCGAFESAAASFQNKEKNEESNISVVQDQKRVERQRRKERKAMEKRKQKEEQDRQGRNNIRRKYRIQSVGIEQYDEYQEDILNFKDSDRESLISYFENNSDLGKSKIGKPLIDDDFFYRQNALDTPTRLLNHSNEFLPKKKRINADKLATRAKKDEQLMKNIKNFQDIERMSNLEKSQKSTSRKAEDERKEMLFKIVNTSEMEKLRTTLRSQLTNQK